MQANKNNIEVGDVLINTQAALLWPIGRTVTIDWISAAHVFFEGTTDYIDKCHLCNYTIMSKAGKEVSCVKADSKRVLSKEEMIIIKHAVTMLYQIGISPAEAEQIFLNGV